MYADGDLSGAMHAYVKAVKRDTRVILLLAIGCGRSLTGRFLLAYRKHMLRTIQLCRRVDYLHFQRILSLYRFKQGAFQTRYD